MEIDIIENSWEGFVILVHNVAEFYEVFFRNNATIFILINFSILKLTSVPHLHNLDQFVLRIFDTLLGRMGNTNIAI